MTEIEKLSEDERSELMAALHRHASSLEYRQGNRALRSSERAELAEREATVRGLIERWGL